MTDSQRSAMSNVLDHPFLRSIGKKIDLDKMLKVEQRAFEYDFPPDGKDDIKNHYVAELLHEAANTPEYAESLKKKVSKDHQFAHNTSGDLQGRKVIDHACPECKQAMQASLQFLERFMVHGPVLHLSATAAVLEATDLAPPKDDMDHSDGTRVLPRVALKGMRDADQVLTELVGRKGLDCKYILLNWNAQTPNLLST